MSDYYIGKHGLCILACGVELHVIGFNQAEYFGKIFITPVHIFMHEEDRP